MEEFSGVSDEKDGSALLSMTSGATLVLMHSRALGRRGTWDAGQGPWPAFACNDAL